MARDIRKINGVLEHGRLRVSIKVCLLCCSLFYTHYNNCIVLIEEAFLSYTNISNVISCSTYDSLL